MYVADHQEDVKRLKQLSTLRAPCGLLVAVMGQPADEVPEASSTWWGVRLEGAADSIVLKDSQPQASLEAFRSRPVHDWEVWANTPAASEAFCRWLSSEVIRQSQQTKQLSAESKERMNALLAHGTPKAQALREVTVEPLSPATAAKLYAWPIA